jgi:DnaJ-class molecular chaperone
VSEDPYKVLGVDKTATQDEIKKAYRALAKKLHPDLHPDDSRKQAEFQAVSGAYDLLRDPETRRRYDAGEIDASGHERPERQYYHQYAGTDRGRRYDPSGQGEEFADMSDFFSDLFGRGGRQGGGARYGQEFSAPGQDFRYQLEVDFLEAARGGKRSVTMPDGARIDLTIPAGLQDGQTLRLKGKGGEGYGKGPRGDALVTVGVRPHPVYSRDGNDILIDVPITVDEAVLGGKIEVPTIGGKVSLTVPKGASTGRKLRLKGKGIKPARGTAGDQIVTLRIMLPDKISHDLEEIAKSWRAKSKHDPRKSLWSQT